MEKTEVLKSVNEVLSVMGKSEVDNNSDLLKSLDSIEQLDFLISLDEKFGVKTNQQQFTDEGLNIVDKLIDFILVEKTK